MSMTRPKEIRLKPVLPNAGVEAAYRRRLAALVRAMQRDVIKAVMDAYRATPPATMAQDDLQGAAASRLASVLHWLGVEWGRRFDDLAPELAAYFAQDVTARSDAALAAVLRRAGFTVRFQITPQIADILAASVAENVALIRSLPAQYLTQVQGHVMRSVQAGGDLPALRRALIEQYGVTARRATLISRDQNNKATAAIQRARQIELGVKEAIWRHSGAGKHPRPEHVAASGKRYDPAKGMYLEGVWTLPGKEINCRCYSVPIVPGLGRDPVLAPG